MKMDGSVFEEKSSFKMLPISFSPKLYWDSCIVSIAKTGTKKWSFICSMKYLSRRLVFISINLQCGLSWNTVVISGLVSLAATETY